MTSPRTVVLLHGVSSNRATWWRVGRDLNDLGWRVVAVDLLAHGARRWSGAGAPTMGDLARDVLQQAPGPVDLVVGHSLGAIVALTVLDLQPGYATRVVLEDPPGPIDRVTLSRVAEEVGQSARRARADRDAEVAAVLRANPQWAVLDAEHAVDGSRELDVEHVVLREPWDLLSLVTGCAVPLHLLAATRDSALLDPDRTELLELPHVTARVVESGHSVHRDRPGVWLHEILTFATATGSPGSVRTTGSG